MCLFTFSCGNTYEYSENCAGGVSKMFQTSQKKLEQLMTMAGQAEEKGCEVTIVATYPAMGGESRDTIYRSTQPKSFGLIHGHEHAPYTVCEGVLFLPPDDAFMQKLVSQ